MAILDKVDEEESEAEARAKLKKMLSLINPQIKA
jgi:hypothetical protein